VKTIAQIFTDKILYCFLGQSIKGKKIEAKSSKYIYVGPEYNKRWLQTAVQSQTPQVCRGGATTVFPEQARVMEQEVQTLLAKGAIEFVPLPDRESGFYSCYFIVPKKDGGMRPILDLRHLNLALRRFRLKMLTIHIIVNQIRSEDWFVTIDLKYGHFGPMEVD